MEINSSEGLGITKQSKNKKIAIYIIGLILLFYSIVTIFPFYVLFIRTFVSTVDSTQLHLIVPKAKAFSMDSKFGNMTVFLDLDTEKFKEDMGIEGYIGPNLTFTQISEKYNIPAKRIVDYMQPFISYNGWITILKGDAFLKSLFATAFITIFTIGLGGFLGISTGFVLAGFRKKWHFMAYNLYMLQIVIPPVMVMIPQFIIITKILHLDNNYWGLILFHLKGGALSTMLFTSYISQIPKEMMESVEIDGGNHFSYFFKILLPLCKVPFATYMAIQIPWYWNELLYPLLFLKPEKYTMIPLINTFVGGQFSTNFQAIYTGLFLSVVPILLIYLIFQKLFIRSAMEGAVKG